MVLLVRNMKQPHPNCWVTPHFLRLLLVQVDRLSASLYRAPVHRCFHHLHLTMIVVCINLNGGFSSCDCTFAVSLIDIIFNHCFDVINLLNHELEVIKPSIHDRINHCCPLCIILAVWWSLIDSWALNIIGFPFDFPPNLSHLPISPDFWQNLFCHLLTKARVNSHKKLNRRIFQGLQRYLLMHAH